MATIDTIKSIVEECLEMDASGITEETAINSMDVDSLDMVELICELEEREGIDFGEPEDIETVGDIIAHVEKCKE